MSNILDGQIRSYDGVLIGPGRTAPSLRDIAVSLARIPRFAGHLSVNYPVLLHSILVATLAAPHVQTDEQLVAEPDTARLMLAGLLHDAHETFTGDIPTPFKTNELRNLQLLADIGIMRAHYPGGYAAYTVWDAQIADADRRAMRAEAWALRTGTPDPETFAESFGAVPPDEDIDQLVATILFATELLALGGEDALATWYIDRVQRMQEVITTGA